jgi:hypothetical protein
MIAPILSAIWVVSAGSIRRDSGCKVVGADVVERHANVAVECRAASIPGEALMVRNVIPLDVDQARNAWKVDLAGETDCRQPVAPEESMK